MLTQAAQDAAVPLPDAALAAPTPLDVLVQLEYVYLLRVVENPQLNPQLKPSAKIPLVEFPAAD